jgi:hypothetical protein
VIHGDLIVFDEGQGEWTHGCIVSCGPKTFDVIVVGGSTLRFKHGSRGVRAATIDDFDGNAKYMESTKKSLQREATAAREERRTGARIKRGQVWPSH